MFDEDKKSIYERYVYQSTPEYITKIKNKLDRYIRKQALLLFV